jgi:hypothetical protein
MKHDGKARYRKKMGGRTRNQKASSMVEREGRQSQGGRRGWRVEGERGREREERRGRYPVPDLGVEDNITVGVVVPHEPPVAARQISSRGQS